MFTSTGDEHDISSIFKTKNGRYSVRSGYYLQWRHQFGPPSNMLALPGGSGMNPVWKIAWKMNAPSKVKKITLQALHGIIPLKCILVNRHIGDTCGCLICNQGLEDVSRLLFTCPAARELWTAFDITKIIDDAVQADRSGSGVLEILLRRESDTA
jgi:hypothetical protein